MTRTEAAQLAYATVERPTADTRQCFFCPLEESRKYLILRSCVLGGETYSCCIRCANEQAWALIQGDADHEAQYHS